MLLLNSSGTDLDNNKDGLSTKIICVAVQRTIHSLPSTNGNRELAVCVLRTASIKSDGRYVAPRRRRPRALYGERQASSWDVTLEQITWHLQTRLHADSLGGRQFFAYSWWFYLITGAQSARTYSSRAMLTNYVVI